jgi:hypothetical protein
MSAGAKRDREEEAFRGRAVERSPWLDWTGTCCSARSRCCPHGIAMEAARRRAVRFGKLARRMVVKVEEHQRCELQCTAMAVGAEGVDESAPTLARGVERRDRLTFFAFVGKDDGMTETC